MLRPSRSASDPARGCRTCLETGAGVPQLQAIREAWLATEGRSRSSRTAASGTTRTSSSPEAVVDGSTDAAVADALATPAEGQSVRVPYVVSVVDVLARIGGHLRSVASYAGETTLEAAHRKIAEDPAHYLVPLSAAGRTESFDR